jgi:hypothetical protein
VQTATCERLFSAFQDILTKKRNRLHSKKVHYLAQVKRFVAAKYEVKHNIETVTKVRLISSNELPRTNTSQVNDHGSQDEGITK